MCADIIEPVRSSTRRIFLKTGTRLGGAGVVLGAVPRPLLAYFGTTPEPVPPIEDDRVKSLAQHAIDTARSMGADYANVLLRSTRRRRITIKSGSVQDSENMNIGVRALVNGYWGFSSSPIWSRDNVVSLAQSATQQAKTSARGKPRPVELSPVPAVNDQHWTMPVTTDPFTVHPDEVLDYLKSLGVYTERRANAAGLLAGIGDVYADFVVQQNAVATTDGTFCTQRLYRTGGEFSFSLGVSRNVIPFTLISITPAGAGWELLRDQPLRAEIDMYIEEALQDLKLPFKPVDVGRYDVVFDAQSMAHIVSPTLGLATELDRALGYEANASGTSYLKDPLEMLGTFNVGSPLLNVTGNRTDPGAVATVRWDDEGVAPEPFAIVTNGVLAGYSSTREGAGWLKTYYEKHGIPCRSHGCAKAGDDWFGSMYALNTHTPNLVIAPGSERVGFEDLITDTVNGLVFKGMGFDMDFQQSNGLGTGKTYEIRNGKRIARVLDAGIIFQASELYKKLTHLGGAASIQRFGLATEKGQPPQQSYHSVSAVPARVKEITVIDVKRKA